MPDAHLEYVRSVEERSCMLTGCSSDAFGWFSTKCDIPVIDGGRIQFVLCYDHALVLGNPHLFD